MTALVGLDVGTSGVKAVAISPTGELLARAERDYPLSTPQPGWAEQDPADWRRAAEEALAALGAGDVVMVKGSLGSRMGPIVRAALARYGASAPADGR